MLAAGDTEAVLGGIAARLRVLDLDRFAGAVDIEGGYGWVTFSLPLAVRLFGHTWLYGAPEVGTWGVDATVRAVLGASIHVAGGWFVRLESQLNYPKLDPYLRRVHLGLAVAFQPGGT